MRREWGKEMEVIFRGGGGGEMIRYDRGRNGRGGRGGREKMFLFPLNAVRVSQTKRQTETEWK